MDAAVVTVDGDGTGGGRAPRAGEAEWAEARDALDAVLSAMAGDGAVAREDQVAAVAELLMGGSRVLVVQATGWGKSAVYWAASRALRRRGGGCTLVVSPLLALMRDQVEAGARAGLSVATLNSANVEEWDSVLAALSRDELDVLLVSPERLGSPSFAPRLAELVDRCALVVIDEAHCISDWGSDFRPDYQRLGRVLVSLGGGVSVLATTATANERVCADVARQLGDTVVWRGSLARTSLRLEVVDGLGPLERYAWVDRALGELEGSGIVYCLTQAEAERLCGFLAARGHSVVSYTGATEPAVRAEVEGRLRRNEVKAVVATSALGMGYDKPDLAFCVHVGSPPSAVSYYQQVGRAGRALDEAVAVLLPAETDGALWSWFATASIPERDHVEAVLAVLDADAGPQSVVAVEASSGVRRGKVEAILKLLAVDGVVVRETGGWRRGDAAWQHDADRWAELRRVREDEAAMMRHYAAGDGCLMEWLQRALDDPGPSACGRCSVCTGQLTVGREVGVGAVEAARAHLRGRDVVIEPRKRWPAGAPWRGAITACGTGRALAYGDDPGWAGALAAHDGRYGDEVAEGVVGVLSRWRGSWAQRPVVVVPMPGPDGQVAPEVAALCAEIGRVGRLPVADVVARRAQGGADTAGGARVTALCEEITVDAAAVRATGDGPVLLVCATSRTGWAHTVAAAKLREAGASSVLPLAVHQLP